MPMHVAVFGRACPEKCGHLCFFLFCAPAFQFRVSGQRFGVQGFWVLGFRVKGLNMPTAHAHLEAGATCTCTIGHQCPMHMHTWAPVCPLSCKLGPSSLCPCTPCMPVPHAPATHFCSFICQDGLHTVLKDVCAKESNDNMCRGSSHNHRHIFIRIVGDAC
jgi:hypothetical protein